MFKYNIKLEFTMYFNCYSGIIAILKVFNINYWCSYFIIRKKK